MADDILITRVDEPIYTKLYKVSGPLLCGHKADIYAECRENLSTEGENDYYLLSFYLSADDYGARETIFYKGIMPSEKVLDLPVDCNTLAGSVNL